MMQAPWKNAQGGSQRDKNSPVFALPPRRSDLFNVLFWNTFIFIEDIGKVQRLTLYPFSFLWIWMFFSFGCFLNLFLVFWIFWGEGTGGGIPCTCSACLLALSYTLAPRLISFWIFTIFVTSLYLHVYTLFSLMWIDFFESAPTHFCKLLNTKNSHFKAREVNIFADFFPIHSSWSSFSHCLTMSSVDVSHLRPSTGSLSSSPLLHLFTLL